jgi:small basic protein (TIGR04137 family)
MPESSGHGRAGLARLLALFVRTIPRMSIHSSLKTSQSGGGQRNVWTRIERLAALQKAGKWSQADGVEGLPKVRTSFKAKAKKKAADAGEAKPAAAAAPAAAPAAKAAPAKK